MSKHTMTDLHQMQAMPLEQKIKMTKRRVDEWIDEYGEDGVYISFSGGKDSTVLLDLVRNEYGYKGVKAMFVDVPTQYPELKKFAVSFGNVDVVKPKKSFAKVCEEYGFPLISKEVSECVCGAKRYLKELQKEYNLNRQTDRHKFSKSPSNAELLKEAHMKALRGGKTQISIRSLTPVWNNAIFKILQRLAGGADCKWRKLRGIGEYSRKKQGIEEWPKLPIGKASRDIKQKQSDSGKYG